MEPLQHIVQSFSTNNLALAIALSAAGCKHPSENGRILAGYNSYSAGFIRAQTDRQTKQPLCSGMSPDKAINLLFSMGIPGNVIYSFERSETLAEACKGWDSQNEPATSLPNVSEEDFGRVAKFLSRSRADYIGDREAGIVPLWRRMDANEELFIPAVFAQEGRSHTEQQGRKTITITRDAKLRGIAIRK